LKKATAWPVLGVSFAWPSENSLEDSFSPKSTLTQISETFIHARGAKLKGCKALTRNPVRQFLNLFRMEERPDSEFPPPPAEQRCADYQGQQNGRMMQSGDDATRKDDRRAEQLLADEIDPFGEHAANEC